MTIRQEAKEDHDIVFEVVREAFKYMPFADGDEHHLVNRLRNSDAFIPELSLVAEKDNRIVGHILLTKLSLIGSTEEKKGLALAPVSVHPDFQRSGIGGQLIVAAHDKARKLGYDFVILIGHEDYYPRFGYEIAAKHNITFSFEVPDINAMVLSLTPDGLNGVSGEVIYDPAFGL